MEKTMKQICDEANGVIKQLVDRTSVFKDAFVTMRREQEITNVIRDFIVAFSKIEIEQNPKDPSIIPKVSTKRRIIYGPGMKDLMKELNMTSDSIKQLLESRVPEKFSVEIEFEEYEGSPYRTVITVTLI